VCHGDQVATRGVAMQHKTQRTVQFEFMQATLIYRRTKNLRAVQLSSKVLQVFNRVKARRVKRAG
jgi:spore germination cell wall hydrolase CwlJ-like protein